MGKTTAEQECANVVKHGIRRLLLGIPPKLIFFSSYTNSYTNITDAKVLASCSTQSGSVNRFEVPAGGGF